MEPIVFLGAGLAGYQCAKEIRRLDGAVPLLIVASDSGDFYSKPMLSNAFASNKTPDTLVLKRSAQMGQELGADILPRAVVDAIFPEDREIAVRGRKIGYSKLVLALGADPIRFHEGTLSVNDLADYAKFRQALEGKKKVAILGAGLVGCEFADDLSRAGFVVDVYDIADRPLGRLVPPECGHWIERSLNVNWHFNAKVSKIEQGHVHLEDGSVFDAEIVLSAIGLKPRTKLAFDAGIEVGRGIRVDRHLETSQTDIYAIGDCMEVEGIVLPFVMPIMHASRILAANLLGKREKLVYPAMPVVVKTPSCPLVVSPPNPEAKGQWQSESGTEGVKSLFIGDDGKMLGFALCGKVASEKNALARELPQILS